MLDGEKMKIKKKSRRGISDHQFVNLKSGWGSRKMIQSTPAKNIYIDKIFFKFDLDTPHVFNYLIPFRFSRLRQVMEQRSTHESVTH